MGYPVMSSNPENPLGYPWIFVNRSYFFIDFAKNKIKMPEISVRMTKEGHQNVCANKKGHRKLFSGQIETSLITRLVYFSITGLWGTFFKSRPFRSYL